MSPKAPLLLLLFLLLLAAGGGGKKGRRRRTALVECEEEGGELEDLVDTERFVAVLYHDTSKMSMRTLHDLELIVDDCMQFGILWRRVQGLAPEIENEEQGQQQAKDGAVPPAAVIFYMDGLPVRYPGRPDRQSAVFRWLVTELFCHLEKPIPLNTGDNADASIDADADAVARFHILARAFRTFVTIVHSPAVRSSHQLLRSFQSEPELCMATEGVVLVAGAGQAILDAVAPESSVEQLPKVVNIAHGVPSEYDDGLKRGGKDISDILSWIRSCAQSQSRHLSQSNVERLIKREELLLLIFEDPAHPIQAQRIASQLKVSMSEFETVFGLAVATTSDPAVATTLNVQWGQQQLQQQQIQQQQQQPYHQSPVAAVLFDSGVAKHFPGSIEGEDAAIEVRNWVHDLLSLKDRVVFKAIESSEFKSHPDNFKNVLLKEHKDSIRILSMEYARLLKQNQKLKEVIDKAREVLGSTTSLGEDEEEVEESPGDDSEEMSKDGTNNSTGSDNAAKSSKTKKDVSGGGGPVSAECGDCLAAVGQAVWNCGTLEAECIKNALSLKSDCFGCVCEIADHWWPADAPNCYKKDIQLKIDKGKKKKKMKKDKNNGDMIVEEEKEDIPDEVVNKLPKSVQPLLEEEEGQHQSTKDNLPEKEKDEL